MLASLAPPYGKIQMECAEGNVFGLMGPLFLAPLGSRVLRTSFYIRASIRMGLPGKHITSENNAGRYPV